MSQKPPFAIAGLLGWPVAQSRSPMLHGYWLEKHGIAGAYVPLAVPPDRLTAALAGLVALGFKGCNVTVPHKEKVLALIDRVDPLAKRIGAVNMLVVGEDGSLSGFNNDAFGFIENLKEGRPGWRADAGPVMVLGAGGGARAVVVSLADRGAKDIRIVNRTRARAQGLAAEFGPPMRALVWEQRAAALGDAALVVNATTQGMINQPPLDLPLDNLRRDAVVCDIVYNPLETPLLAAARARGNVTINGLGMLLHQARPAFRAWFGVMPEVTPELRRKIEATI